MFVNRMYAEERRARPPERPRPKALTFKIGEVSPALDALSKRNA